VNYHTRLFLPESRQFRLRFQVKSPPRIKPPGRKMEGERYVAGHLFAKKPGPSTRAFPILWAIGFTLSSAALYLWMLWRHL
jgi:hypothetical protein